MNVNKFKKAVAANLNKLDQKFDEFKSSASHNLQNIQQSIKERGARGVDDWTTDDINPLGNQFPVDVPPTIDINGETYRFTKLLDEGGYSFVFLVKNVATGQDYAMKRLLLQEEEMLQNAMNEIKVMEQINGHSNIINFVGYKKLSKGHSHELYILMELAEDSLISIMQKKADYGEHFAEDELFKLFLQICQAVAHMHSQNPPISHRDLKVENVLVGGDGRYKLCDFGSCTTAVYTLQDKSEKMIAEEDIQKNTTMAYRAPEMADLYSGWQIDEKADVWALGCVLYKMCFFVGPFEEASTLQIINCKYRIPSNNVYSSKVLDTIKYMLEVDPSKRPSVFDVVERVAKLAGMEVNVTRPPPRARAAPTKSLNVRQASGKTSNTNIRKTQHKATGSSGSTSGSSSGGGDLFGMLDWYDNTGAAVTSASKTTTTTSNNAAAFDAFGDDDSWAADFSELEISSSSQQQPQQQQQQPRAKATIAPPSPVHTRTHIRQPSNSSSVTSNNSPVVTGNDLFSQLDWQSNTSSTSNTTATPIRPPSPQNAASSHRRTQSASQANNFNLDSLFDSVSENEPSIAKIQALPGNHICADCSNRDPNIAIVNLGILVCDSCASVHRTLGEQISKVQPLNTTLTLEQLRYLQSVGNDRANQFWEANLTDPSLKPSSGSNVGVLNAYIRNKYLAKRFAPSTAPRVGTMPRSLSGNLAGGAPMMNNFPPQQQGVPMNMPLRGGPGPQQIITPNQPGYQQTRLVSPTASFDMNNSFTGPPQPMGMMNNQMYNSSSPSGMSYQQQQPMGGGLQQGGYRSSPTGSFHQRVSSNSSTGSGGSLGDIDAFMSFK